MSFGHVNFLPLWKTASADWGALFLEFYAANSSRSSLCFVFVRAPAHFTRFLTSSIALRYRTKWEENRFPMTC